MATKRRNRSVEVFLSPVRCLFSFALAAAFSFLTAADASLIAKRSGVNPILRQTIPPADSQAKLPAGLTLVDWNQIKAEYERHRHGMFPDGQGGYQSRSHYHGWLTWFDGKGFTVQPDSESWSWGLELERWGRQGEEVAVGGAMRILKDVNRLEYRRQGITEWFVNGKEGLEHGFTIRHRPGGGEGELSLQLRQRGDLVAEQDAGGRAVSYKTAQGEPALRYRKLLVTDAHGRSLPAYMVSEGSLVRIFVDDRQAVYPIAIDPITQQAYLKASNADAGDQFGYSVAVSGESIVVGAPGERSRSVGVNGDEGNNSAPNSGAAYVFVREGMQWRQQAYLKASNTDVLDAFGTAVAISLDTIAVGAIGESSAAKFVNGDQRDNSQNQSGAVYVFIRNRGQWVQQAYIKASNTGATDWFGNAVGLSGDTLVVGARREDSSGSGVNGDQANDNVPDSGAAYVFIRTGGLWTQQAYLKASNRDPGDAFGAAVAISGDSVVVSAIGEDSGSTGVNGSQSNNVLGNSGAAYVFVRRGTGWSQQAYLKASNPGSEDLFGAAVAISGDTLAVGAPQESSSATGVDGNQLDKSARSSGAGYVFVRNGTQWRQQAYMKASNTKPGSGFGASVALSGDTLLIGSPGEASSSSGIDNDQNDTLGIGSGAAYMFVRTADRWAARPVYMKASNNYTKRVSFFGYAVALVDGLAVVTSPNERNNSRGVNGSQNAGNYGESGAGYVFDYQHCSSSPTDPRIDSISDSAASRDVFVQGQWVSIYGENLSSSSRLWGPADFPNGLEANRELPRTLDGVSVVFGDKPASVLYVSPKQVNVQVPGGLPLGRVTVTLENRGVRSCPFTVPIERSSIGLFTYVTGGLTFASALHPSGALVGEPSLVGAGAQPVRLGQTVSLFASGLGASPAGVVVSYRVFDQEVQVIVGGFPVKVLGTVLIYPGQFQINIEIPQGHPVGRLPVTIIIGNDTSNQTVFLPVTP